MPAKFFLLGDRHAGAIRRGAIELCVPFTGGSLQNAGALKGEFFWIRKGRLVMRDRHAERALRRYLRHAGSKNLLEMNLPILATMGFGVGSILAPMIRQDLAIADAGFGRQYISKRCFEAGICDQHAGPIAFYRTLIAAGCRVYATFTPQQFKTEHLARARAIQEAIAALVSRLGVTMVDVREETTDDHGVLLDRYTSAREGDKVHGNAEYGKVVVRKFLSMAAIDIAEPSSAAAQI